MELKMQPSNVHQRNCRGAALLLTLIAIGIGFVLGFMFVASSATARGNAMMMQQHAQARQCAESAMRATIEHIRATPNWRSTYVPGLWLDDVAVLAGTVDVSATYDPSLASGDIAIGNASFELSTGSLSTPLLFPPMSGTLGGWSVVRTALVETGATVPLIGMRASATATDGSNEAFITFGLSITGSGTFTRTVAAGLQPNTRYEFTVDARASGIVILDGDVGFRVLAGSAVIASTEHSWTLALPALPADLPTEPLVGPTGLEFESLLTIFSLSNNYAEYTLTFETGDSPPAGSVNVQLFAQSAGVASWASFDNLRMAMTASDPVVITGIAHQGDASYSVTATVDPSTGSIIAWDEN